MVLTDAGGSRRLGRLDPVLPMRCCLLGLRVRALCGGRLGPPAQDGCFRWWCDGSIAVLPIGCGRLGTHPVESSPLPWTGRASAPADCRSSSVQHGAASAARSRQQPIAAQATRTSLFVREQRGSLLGMLPIDDRRAHPVDADQRAWAAGGTAAVVLTAVWRNRGVRLAGGDAQGDRGGAGAGGGADRARGRARWLVWTFEPYSLMLGVTRRSPARSLRSALLGSASRSTSLTLIVRSFSRRDPSPFGALVKRDAAASSPRGVGSHVPEAPRNSPVGVTPGNS